MTSEELMLYEILGHGYDFISGTLPYRYRYKPEEKKMSEERVRKRINKFYRRILDIEERPLNDN